MKIAVAWTLLAALLAPANAQARDPERELRGVWMTPRTPSGLWTRAELAAAMEGAAKAKFNTVFFNAWSRGWPLWRSKIFEREAGHLTDPLAGDRDLLGEAVAEGHRHGLEVVAWMEYGFVGWWDGQEYKGATNGPLFAKHPDWLARNPEGNERFASGKTGNHLWMVQNHPQVQDFLIRLHEEVVRVHEVDGIELDRIRFPGLECGYDAYTLEQWKQETGSAPPKSPSDPKWMRFRADALVRFHADAYKAIKTARPTVHVSNAPSHYASGKGYPAYEKLLQDWRAWVNAGTVDSVEVQMYVRAQDLRKYIPSALEGVTPEMRKKVYAGIAPVTSAHTLSPSETAELVDTVRKAGLGGHAIWYWNDVRDERMTQALASKAYATPAMAPWCPKSARRPGIVLDVQKAKAGSGWKPVTSPHAALGTFLQAEPGKSDPVEYVADVPEAGTYTVYAWFPGGAATPQTAGIADFSLRCLFWTLHGRGDAVGTQAKPDVTERPPEGWYRLGSLPLDKGDKQRIATLRNVDAKTDARVLADAMMLVQERGPLGAVRDASGPKK